MPKTDYHPFRDLSRAKLRHFFRRYFTMEKTRQASGKKSEDPSSSLHCALLCRNAVWQGLKHESFHVVSHLSQVLKILGSVEIIADFVESILKRLPAWLRMNIKVELQFPRICKVLYRILVIIGIACECSGGKHHFIL